MKLEECKDCYYEGTKKCFLYDKEFKDLNIKKCTEGFLDPYKNYNENEGTETCISFKPIDK